MSLPYEFTAEEIISQGRTTKENIEAIKIWLPECGSEFVPDFLCDEMIVLFLLSCDNDVEVTKTTIIGHYKSKSGAPEIFDNRHVDGDDISTFLDTWIVSTFPYRTSDNCVIYYFQLVDSDYSKMDNIAFLKVFSMLVDVTQDKDPPDGIITIVDLQLAHLKHITTFKLDANKKFVKFLQEGLTSKIKAMHIINSRYFVVKLFNIIKICIKSELLEKIHFHSQGTSLDELYGITASKKGLPVEFGGDLPSLKELRQHTKKLFEQRQEYWNAEERIRKNCQYFQKNNTIIH